MEEPASAKVDVWERILGLGILKEINFSLIV
jgi:hypothetical protein